MSRPKMVEVREMRDVSGAVVTVDEYEDVKKIVAAVIGVPEERRGLAFARAFGAVVELERRRTARAGR
jgi:hypothetical protein